MRRIEQPFVLVLELTGTFRLETRADPMTSFKFLAGAAALGCIAAPAAAQYQSYPYQQTYPQYPQQYPQQTYPGYGYQQPYTQGYTGNPVTDIIDSLLGNRYNVTDRQAVRQCAQAAMSQASAQFGGNAYGGGYNRGYGSFRVTSISDVQRRSNGLRVSGTMSSGGGYQNQAYGYGSRGGYGTALSFRCNVDYRGAVTGLRVRPAGGY
jgi:hypothetical protein